MLVLIILGGGPPDCKERTPLEETLLSLIGDKAIEGQPLPETDPSHSATLPVAAATFPSTAQPAAFTPFNLPHTSASQPAPVTPAAFPVPRTPPRHVKQCLLAAYPPHAATASNNSSLPDDILVGGKTSSVLW